PILSFDRRCVRVKAESWCLATTLSTSPAKPGSSRNCAISRLTSMQSVSRGRREGGGVGAGDQVGGRQEVGDDQRAAGLEMAGDVVEQCLLVLDQACDLDAEDHVVATREGIARAV